MNSQKIRFSCPNCGIQLDVPASLAGVSGPCPACHSTITAPSAPAPEPSFAAPAPAPAPTPAPAPAPAPEMPPQEPVQPTPLPAQLDATPPSSPAPTPQHVQELGPQDYGVETARAEVRTSPQETGFPIEEPTRSVPSIPEPKSYSPGEPTSRGGAIRSVSDMPSTAEQHDHASAVKNKSRIPSILFILAVFFIAGSVIVWVLKLNGIFDINIPFLPTGKQETTEGVRVGSEISTKPPTSIDTIIDGVGSPAQPPSEVDPLSIDPEMPSKSDEAPSAPPAGTAPPLPAGENFREGETPLSPEVDLPDASESEIFSQRLMSFLEAENLVGRESAISATALQDPKIAQSILAGPLPAPTSVNFWTKYVDAAEQRTDFFYLVSWDGERGSPKKPISVQLHRWSEREQPRIHAEAFLEAYEGALIRYAAAAREEPGRFHVLGRCVPKCFEIIPDAIDKATLKLASFPKDSTPIKAYFSKNGDLLDEFKESLDGIAMKQEVPLTVTLQWSSPKSEPRYLELVRVDAFDWHP